jgi:hypothetical protein
MAVDSLRRNSLMSRARENATSLGVPHVGRAGGRGCVFALLVPELRWSLPAGGICQASGTGSPPSPSVPVRVSVASIMMDTSSLRPDYPPKSGNRQVSYGN